MLTCHPMGMNKQVEQQTWLIPHAVGFICKVLGKSLLWVLVTFCNLVEFNASILAT